MDTKEIIDRIFKEPNIQYELTEFENLGKPIHEIINIYPKVIESGRDAGQTKYYLKSIVPFCSGKEEVQVYVEGGKSAPEEIVRQLWVYKLVHHYGYKPEEIDLEKSVHFGTDVGTKAADIIVYTDSTKITPKIIVETKKPKRKEGIEQLKSYMNAKGAPVAIWSNGSDSVILFRPYPAQFDDTLVDIPQRGQEPKDVLEAKKTLLHLKRDFNFKKIIQDLEELVLADSGKDEFNEIFKLIFAKIWDEKEAEEKRKDKHVEFRKAIDPEITYDRINALFHNACDEWPGIFRVGEDIELANRHLQVCVGPIEGVRLMGSNLRVMDDAFEYLLPTESKKKKGQFFTPRHVVEMCVRMLNPKRDEYVIDPACGSGGFLLHAMEWSYPVNDNDEREFRKSRYASKYLWGIDFEQRAAKTSRALMLIAGDGHTNIFGPDVSSLDPKTWYETASGQDLMQKLRLARLTEETIPENETLRDDDKAWHYFKNLKFDLVFANPPFAGEMKDRQMLAHYELAQGALKRAKDKQPKEERDVLFIERILNMLKPGGRAAIVLPQGKFNNSSLAFIREWILKQARLLAVVGLHPNTFKPHTGTKTSVLFIQKYTDLQLEQIKKIQQEVAGSCPNYNSIIQGILENNCESLDIDQESIPEEIWELLDETFSERETELVEESTDETNKEDDVDYQDSSDNLEDLAYQTEETLRELKAELLRHKQALIDLESDYQALEAKHAVELEIINEQYWNDKKYLNSEVKRLKAVFKNDLKDLKQKQKEIKKSNQKEIKRLEKDITDTEYSLKLLSNRGKLELILEDVDLVSTLNERWISAEVAQRLDYPIFMAVSERGGKDNSGNYQYLVDEKGGLVEFSEGHRQAGQLQIDQDLVNFELDRAILEDTSNIRDESLCTAEAFISFAQEQNLSFWKRD